MAGMVRFFQFAAYDISQRLISPQGDLVLALGFSLNAGGNGQLTLLTDGVVEARDMAGMLYGFERAAASASLPPKPSPKPPRTSAMTATLPR
jgi:hypothetical protein